MAMNVIATEAPANLKGMLESYERQLIVSALERAGGHQRAAASALGILPTTLHEKMTRLGIPTARAGRF
jgi:DNA-binding NtrC family response regulator